MKSKPWSLCREFGCRNPTWSGKIEHNIALRYCVGHEPGNLIRLNKASPPKEEKQSTRARANPHFISLVCVYRAYETVRGEGGVVQRVVFLRGMCGERAPRRTMGDKSLPRFANWRGEPLCREHGHESIAQSRVAFPDDSLGEVVPEVALEVNEERMRRDDKLVAFLAGEPVEANTRPNVQKKKVKCSPKPEECGFTALPDTLEQWNVPYRTAIRLKVEFIKKSSLHGLSDDSQNLEWAVFTSEEKRDQFVDLYHDRGWVRLSRTALITLKRRHHFNKVRKIVKAPDKLCVGCGREKPITFVSAGSPVSGHWHFECLKKARVTT